MAEKKELAAALAKAQAVMQAADFDAVNPFHGSSYATLGSIIKAARQPLADNGLAFTQLIFNDDGRIGVHTILMHVSGEQIECQISLPVGDEKGRSLAQSTGAVISYLRRYSLASMLGIYAEADLDGEESKQKAPPAKTDKQANNKPPAQAQQPAQPIDPPASLMTLEMAMAETNRDGMKYGEIETSLLANMANTLAKKLKDNGLKPEEREDKQRKLDACRVILADRAKAA